MTPIITGQQYTLVGSNVLWHQGTLTANGATGEQRNASGQITVALR